jgi:hypothetical protein
MYVNDVVCMIFDILRSLAAECLSTSRRVPMGSRPLREPEDEPGLSPGGQCPWAQGNGRPRVQARRLLARSRVAIDLSYITCISR